MARAAASCCGCGRRCLPAACGTCLLVGPLLGRSCRRVLSHEAHAGIALCSLSAWPSLSTRGQHGNNRCGRACCTRAVCLYQCAMWGTRPRRVGGWATDHAISPPSRGGNPSCHCLRGFNACDLRSGSTSTKVRYRTPKSATLNRLIKVRSHQRVLLLRTIDPMKHDLRERSRSKPFRAQQHGGCMPLSFHRYPAERQRPSPPHSCFLPTVLHLRQLDTGWAKAVCGRPASLHRRRDGSGSLNPSPHVYGP
jgi:hypothetical protein